MLLVVACCRATVTACFLGVMHIRRALQCQFLCSVPTAARDVDAAFSSSSMNPGSLMCVQMHSCNCLIQQYQDRL